MVIQWGYETVGGRFVGNETGIDATSAQVETNANEMNVEGAEGEDGCAGESSLLQIYVQFKMLTQNAPTPCEFDGVEDGRPDLLRFGGSYHSLCRRRERG